MACKQRRAVGEAIMKAPLRLFKRINRSGAATGAGCFFPT
jgi:hypothetical protein